MSASISTTTLSLVITFWRGNTYTVSRRSILSVRKWRANESPAGVTITWCQSMARGLSMIGMIRLTPEDSVRWYFPSRSMIIVWACWTMRIPRATIEIANSAMAAGTISAPMLSIAHISLSTYRVAPSTRTTITRVPGSSAASMSDALRDDPHLARERVHVGPDGGSARMQMPQQERPDAHEGQESPGGEAQRRHDGPRDDQRDDPSGQAADGHRQQPKAGREHLGHEQEQGGDEPDLPFVHGVNLARVREPRNRGNEPSLRLGVPDFPTPPHPGPSPPGLPVPAIDVGATRGRPSAPFRHA